MHNNEEILKKGSKAFKLIKRLRNYACVCFKEGDSKYEAVMSNISALENLFEPYTLEFEALQEKEKQRKNELKQICSQEGHIGEWKEDHYTISGWIDRQYVENIPLIRWVRICERCGEVEVAEREPDEVRKLRIKKEIQLMEEEIDKKKSEL